MLAVQRQSVTMATGGVVGTSGNLREDVLQAMDRLHMLWSITDEAYRVRYPEVSRLAPGTRLPALSGTIMSALRQNEEPSIAAPVAARFLNATLSGPVGPTGGDATDMIALGRALRTYGYLAPADFTTELGSGPPAPFSGLTATRAALVNAKRDIVAGTFGRTPLHAEEAVGGRFDRLTDQTFDCGIYLVFVPHGVTTANNVHIYFSALGATGGGGQDSVTQHGLRTAADDTPWIVIGVPGADPGFVTISTADIHSCLARAGRPAQVDDIRLSAHSRGYKGLQETVRRRLIEVGKVSRVVAFDANYRTLVAALSHAGIPAARVTAYQVTPGGGGPLRMAGSRTINLSDIAGPLRAIAYVRLIQDVMVTRPTLAIPPGVRAQLFPVPPLRTLSTRTPTPSGKQNIRDFTRAHQSEINRILAGEARRPDGLMRFMEDNDLAGLGAIYDPGIYSHHFFVTEVAHEVTD
jgi:hypothetical protein